VASYLVHTLAARRAATGSAARNAATTSDPAPEEQAS
jgi:hypothetical protein